MAAAKFEALAAPPGALELGGTEVLRAVIVERGLQVSLKRGFDDPTVWGILLADVARHVSRIFAKEENLDEEIVLADIRSMFDAEIDRATDIGTTNAIS